MRSGFDPQRWPEVQAAFEALIDLATAEQAERLARIGATDPDLRIELERMIAADERGGARLARVERILAIAHEHAAATVDVLGVVGRTMSHFRILEPLASGGMGVLYRAEDLELRRFVALKFPLPDRRLDPAMRERFRQEARAAGGLDHPNICSIYEVGETENGFLFIAMPLYEGETLSARLARDGHLPVREAVAIARQIASGLEAAHEKSIVHRDLKPANVMLLADGSIRILDFGLAKVAELTLTTSGTFLGTVSYMAPEQILGRPVDVRTDLWALGVLLFEMVTGSRPFVGEHEISVAHAIVNSPPGPPAPTGPDLPPALAEVVDRLLSKDAAARPSSAGSVIAALDVVENERTGNARQTGKPRRGRAAALLTRRRAAVALLLIALGAILAELVARSDKAASDVRAAPSIAVLPFANTIGDSASDYIAAGITDELTSILGTVDRLRVAARVPGSTLANSDALLRAVAAKLNVKTVLRGSVRAGRGRLQVSSELLDVANGRVLWAQTYDRPMREVFAVHNEIVGSVLAALGVSAAGGAVGRRTANLEAYDLYLRGRHSWRMRSREGLEGAAAYYEQAIERDPAFALAYSGLAEAHVNMSNYGHRPARQALALARVAADRALSLDPALAEAHAVKGYVQASNLEFREAEASLQRALAHNPNFAWAHHYYTLLLLMLGRAEEAQAENRAALALDPLSLPANATRGIIRLEKGDVALAIQELQAALALAPDFALTLFYLGGALAADGSLDESARTLQLAAKVAPDFLGVPGALAYVYERTGRPASADSIIASLRGLQTERGFANLALAYGALGRLNEAFRLLPDVSWDVPSVIALRADPLLARLRADPRYTALLEELGATTR